MCVYVYIYIYCWVSMRPPFFGIYELISGPRRVNKRPPPSEITVFVVRNPGAAFCRKSIIVSRWWTRALCRKPMSEDLLRFFFGLAKSVFLFFISGVLALGGEVKEVERSKTLQNKGVSERFYFVFQ